MRYTCKKLTEMFKKVNRVAKVEILKGNKCYQLKVDGGKFIVEASTLKELVDIIKSKTSGKSMVLTRIYKKDTWAIAIGVPIEL